ncbi:galactose oxidase-like domain-containing protein [Streptomyces sp. NPDC059002]|uniref:galactose oxidase-like domain-containing protein n=1 Tax=Streptomyces sp. NPDC059002 TaxID=3346690 RepID=UPI00369C6724
MAQSRIRDGHDHPDRRAVLGGAAAVAAGGALMGMGGGTGFAAQRTGRAIADGHDVGVVDISSAGEPRSTPRPWVSMRLDGEGKGEAVPLRLRAPQHRTASTRVTVTSTTGRTVVSSTGERAGRSGASRSLTVPPGAELDVWVTPLRAGDPMEPADTLLVTTPDGQVKVDAYVEPSLGEWRKAGPNNAKLDLDIVAIHAVQLRQGDHTEVAMWSLPRLKDKNGKPLPHPTHKGQWQWDLFGLGDSEAAALDVETLKTRKRDLTPDKDGKRPNIFCSAGCALPDGRMLVAGGHIGHNAGEGHLTKEAYGVYIYDPAKTDEPWTKVGGMKLARWYPTVTNLPDGRVLISTGSQSVLLGDHNDHITEGGKGKYGYFSSINNQYDVFDPATNKLEPFDEDAFLVDIDQIPDRDLDDMERRKQLSTYPGVYVLPKGDADAYLAIVESNRGWLTTLDTRNKSKPVARAEAMYTMATKGSRTYPHYGSSVLLPFHANERGAQSKLSILAVGGQQENNDKHRELDEDGDATATAEVFEVDTAKGLKEQQGWQHTSVPMNSPRVLCDATLLADGKVLISGGTPKGWGNLNWAPHKNWEPIYQSEIYDPETKYFTWAARAATDRRYHSTALLQPDGTVLKAGSTGGFNLDVYKDGPYKGQYKYFLSHTDAERYYPPYLFRGPRPALQGAPQVMKYGQSVNLNYTGHTTHDKIRVALIRLGAMTHGNNMSQRYVWLQTTGGAPAADSANHHLVKVAVPKNPAVAPPGDYMLVVVSDNGVPSEAKIVTVKK